MSAELFIGYAPAFDRMPGWTPVFRHAYGTPGDVVVRRVIWSRTADASCRLLVDVSEGVTSPSAERRLAEIKDESNVRFVEGPARLGRGAVMSGAVNPRSVYFTRANMLIWLLSVGEGPCDVLAFADAIVSDLDAAAPMQGEEDLALKREPDRSEAPGAMCLRAQPKWARGEWAWYRFTAEEGTLSRTADSDDILVWPASPRGDVSVTGWAMEPGRKPYRGRYVGSR